MRLLRNKDGRDSHPHVYIADKEQLESCLKYLGNRPLKLISNSCYKDESEWKERDWSFTKEGASITDKKLLISDEDAFQVSVANEFSKQDRHVHHGTLEIYISEFPMKLTLDSNKTAQDSRRGLIIIPPGVTHVIELSGLTYVVQIMQKGMKISSDKEIISGI